jgi:hypothetical protein
MQIDLFEASCFALLIVITTTLVCGTIYGITV